LAREPDVQRGLIVERGKLGGGAPLPLKNRSSDFNAGREILKRRVLFDRHNEPGKISRVSY
jgi:hypothetical protein